MRSTSGHLAQCNVPDPLVVDKITNTMPSVYYQIRVLINKAD